MDTREPASPPEGGAPERPKSPYLPANIAVAFVGGLLTLWLAATMPHWARDETSSISYFLIAPFLLVPPLWALSALSFAARAMILEQRGALAWLGFAAAFVLNLYALPRYIPALASLLGLMSR